jgi:hypothetical protein
MSFKLKALVSAVALSSTLVACEAVEDKISGATTPTPTVSPSSTVSPTVEPTLATATPTVSPSSIVSPTTVPTPTTVVVDTGSSITPQGQMAVQLDNAKQGVDGAAKSLSASAASSLSSISAMLTPLSNMMPEDEGGVVTTSESMAKAYKVVSSEFKALATRSAVTEAENELNISASDMEALMTELFDMDTAVLDEANNTISLKLNLNKFCDLDDYTDFGDAQDMYTECLKVLGKVTLSITAINEYAGVVTLMYGDNAPFQLAYEPSAMAVLVDLAEFKATIIELADDGDLVISTEIPSTFEGQAAVSIKVNTNTVEVSTWIQEAIAIGEGQNNLTISATDNLATLTLDSLAQTIHLTADVNSINGQVNLTQFDDEYSDETGEWTEISTAMPLNIAFFGGTADVLVDAHEQKVTVKNTGTDSSGLALMLDNEMLFEASLAKLSATLDIANEYVLFDSVLDASLSAVGEDYNCNDGSIMLRRTVDIDITSGTSITDTNIYNGTMSMTLTEENLETNEVEVETGSISDGDDLNDMNVNIGGGVTICTSNVYAPTSVPTSAPATIATVVPTAIAPTIMPNVVF